MLGVGVGMEEDDVNKIECLIGYLEYWNRDSSMKFPPQELNAILEDANEWLNAIKEQLNDRKE